MKIVEFSEYTIVRCCSCDHEFRVPDCRDGMTIVCPKCGRAITIREPKHNDVVCKVAEPN